MTNNKKDKNKIKNENEFPKVNKKG